LLNKSYVSTISHKQSLLSPNKQIGGVLIIAIFIIIVLSLLGTSMLSLQRTSMQQSVYDVYATRASLAAYSANEVAMIALFANKENSNASAVCLGKAERIPVILPKSTTGFANCQAFYTCKVTESNIGKVYNVVSAGICQDKELNIYREITTDIMR